MDLSHELSGLDADNAKTPGPWVFDLCSFLSRLIVALSPRRESRAFTSINDLRKAAFLNKEPEGELLSLAAPSLPAIPDC